MWSFGDMAENMCRYAGALHELGIGPGNVVAILAPNGAFLVQALLAVQCVGAASLLIYPPGATRSEGEFSVQLAEQLRGAGATALIIADEFASEALPGGKGESRESRTHFHTIRQVDLIGSTALSRSPEALTTALAHLQFTSGSTGRKRGVMLTHQHLLDNTQAIRLGLELGPSARMVSWLPLAHDMGLIGGVLTPLLSGFPVWLMRPSQFVMRPIQWLRAITQFGGTVTFSPNFGFQRCVNAIKESDCEGLDLSTLRVAVCAAEPVVRATVQAFVERFRRHGLREGVVCPSYGLAENTVGATASPVGRPARFERIDYGVLVGEQRAERPGSSRPFVDVASVGFPLPGVELSVVGEDGEPVGERRVGEIIARGRMVAEGYYGDPEATAATFRGGALSTGDYGFLLDGELFVTGRRKELIIHAGRNYYPQDLEAAASSVPGVRQVAAFGVTSAALGTEEIVLLVDARASSTEDKQRIITSCRQQVLATLAVSVSEVCLVSSRTIPKTTSGKLRRTECKRIYLAMKEENHDSDHSCTTTA